MTHDFERQMTGLLPPYLRRVLALSLCVLATGCARHQRIAGRVHTIKISAVALKHAATPAAWRDVKFESSSVHGVKKTGLKKPGTIFLWQLDRAPTAYLTEVLQQRLPNAAGSVSLSVENVRVAFKLSGFGNTSQAVGASADFVLRRGAQSKRISLQHTSNGPYKPNLGLLYSRSIVDLTDRLLFHKEALGFLKAPPAAAIDSALSAEVAVGPVAKINPTDSQEASGRIVWGNTDAEIGGSATILANSDAPGVLASFDARVWYGRWGWRAIVGAGFLKVGDGVFYQSLLVGFDFGYRGIAKTAQGYVEGPGISLVVVPQVFFFNMLGGSDFRALQFGASAEVEIPLGKYFGLTAAFYGGVMAPIGGGIDPIGIYYPFGDMYIQTSSGKYSLGLLFQKLSGGGSIFDNPTITLTYRTKRGRGIAFERTKLELPVGSQDSDKDFSTPDSAFVGPKSHVFATADPAPSVSPSVAPTVPASPTAPVPPTAPTSPTAPVQPTTPTPTPPRQKLNVLVGPLKLDAKLGAAATQVLLETITKALTTANGKVADAEKAKQHASVIGITKIKTAAQGCAIARSLVSSHYLQLSAVLDKVDPSRVAISVSLHQSKDCSSRSVGKTVSRVEMLTAVEKMVLRLAAQAN